MDRVQYIVYTLDTTFRSEAKMSRQNIFLYKKECIVSETGTTEWFDIFFPECTSREYYVKNIM